MTRVICAWCGDLMRVDADNRDFVMAARNEMDVTISHGICDDCQERVLHPDPEVVETVWGRFVVGGEG